MTLNKAYSLPSSQLSLSPLCPSWVFLCSPQPCPHLRKPGLPGRGAVVLAGSTLRLITLLILGLPVCLQGKNSGMNPPSAPTPTLLLSLYLLSPSSSTPFIPLSLCCQRHWGTTLSHSSRQGHSLALPALFAICHGKWGSRGLCHGLRGKRNDKGRWIGDECCGLPELGNRVEQKKPVQ